MPSHKIYVTGVTNIQECTLTIKFSDNKVFKSCKKIKEVAQKMLKELCFFSCPLL